MTKIQITKTVLNFEFCPPEADPPWAEIYFGFGI
jgi:hypothetical protein